MLTHDGAEPLMVPGRPNCQISLVPKDMPWGDLDALAWVGRHEVLHLFETVTGEIGDGLLAFAAVIVAVIESYHVKRAHRP